MYKGIWERGPANMRCAGEPQDAVDAAVRLCPSIEPKSGVTDALRPQDLDPKP